MYIEHLQIYNYRSLKNNFIELHQNEPNIFIGINDCGKTSILKAFELLLEEKPKFSFVNDTQVKCDLSNTKVSAEEFQTYFTNNNIPPINYDENSTVLIAKLIIEENEITDEVQENLTNHLLWAIENGVNVVFFARVFYANTSEYKDYLLTREKNDEVKAYYNEKQQTINSIRRNLEITDEEINNDNNRGRFTNLELIRAIYNRYECTAQWVEYKIKKDLFFFLKYRYIDWNITLTDLNEFTNEILKNSISQNLETAKTQANTQAGQAQTLVNLELENFTNQFASDLPNIERLKAHVTFDVKSNITDILINKINADGDIHLDSQGEGIKKQIWFSLIKWKALRDIAADNNEKKYLWCFDEPENHLYPKAQREFFEIIRNVCSSNVQALVSTHSTIFIDRANFNLIRKVDLLAGYSMINRCMTIEDIYESLQLKNSDFLFYDKFIAYEGDTEEILIPHLYKLHTGRTLLSDGIQKINLGGKNQFTQNKDILKQVLSDFRKTNDCVVFVLDNDARFNLTQHEIDNNNIYFLGKQDIEDSIASSVWLQVIEDNFSEHFDFTIEEIEAIKDAIPNNREIDANQKFYPKLKRDLIAKLENNDEYYIVNDKLPSKGKQSGELLIEYLESTDLISENLFSAFDALNN